MALSLVIHENPKEYIHHDQLFKQLIHNFFAEFLEAFFPEVHNQIDFSQLKPLSEEMFTDAQVSGAPAMLLAIIERKLGYQGRSIKKIDTYAVKASQFNHVTGKYTKKQLSERWHDFGEYRIQRDLYSAFLIGNTVETLNSVDVDLCNTKWKNFVKLHNGEIERLKQSTRKTLRWFVA